MGTPHVAGAQLFRRVIYALGLRQKDDGRGRPTTRAAMSSVQSIKNLTEGGWGRDLADGCLADRCSSQTGKLADSVKSVPQTAMSRHGRLPITSNTYLSNSPHFPLAYCGLTFCITTKAAKTTIPAATATKLAKMCAQFVTLRLFRVCCCRVDKYAAGHFEFCVVFAASECRPRCNYLDFHYNLTTPLFASLLPS